MNNIFVTDAEGNTVTLKQYLTQQDEQEKFSEAEFEIKLADKGTKASIFRPPHYKSKTKNDNVVSTKVFNQSEIEEYTMQSTANLRRRVFDAAYEMKSFTSKEITSRVQAPSANVSSMLSRLFAFLSSPLANGVMTRSPEGTGFRYRITNIQAKDAVWEEFQNWDKSQNAAKQRDKKRRGKVDKVSEIKEAMSRKVAESVVAPAIAKGVVDAVVGQLQQINVKVDVTIRIGWLKGE